MTVFLDSFDVKKFWVYFHDKSMTTLDYGGATPSEQKV